MGTFVVLAILIAVVAISLRSVIKNKKANKCGCGCGCGCGYVTISDEIDLSNFKSVDSVEVV